MMQLFCILGGNSLSEEEYSEKVIPISKALVNRFDEESLEHRRIIEDFKREIGSHVSRV